MFSCRACSSNKVSISGRGGRCTFVVQCQNPRCRAEYLTTLSIAGALAGLPRPRAQKPRRGNPPNEGRLELEEGPLHPLDFHGSSE